MNKKNELGFGVVEIIIVVVALAIVGIIGWRFYAANNSTDNSAQTQQTVKDEPISKGTTTLGNIQSETIKSGKGAFSVQIPKGWATLLRPTSEDLLSIKGQSQPQYDASKSVVVEDLGAYGGDSPSLFSVFISDNVVDPKGDSVEFKTGSLTGKKYTYVSPEDTERGMGQEDKGDKFYDYRFVLKDGKQLVVWYQVYDQTDPNDQIETVDKIVKSLQVQ